ncbi:hypothetical protein LR948_18345 [Roseivivax sp. GX 12232]|uniref:hypothetical protein n=1 Tax=Roseivivax sp. GX 12232 TaxID=2900547 RepID=UPI001E63185C|nr:hypothetical protein [Roseivivax sp. GX 12232]MCE0507324.1 hypothetical protein [Roseivivax sp. GX 12232]
MSRIFAAPRTEFRNPLPALLRRIACHLRMRKAIQELEELPSDQLEDLGIAPRTTANRRTSGETGKLPQAPLW